MKKETAFFAERLRGDEFGFEERRSRDVQGVIPRAAAKEIKELSALDAQEGAGGVFVVWTDVHLKSGQHRACFPARRWTCISS